MTFPKVPKTPTNSGITLQMPDGGAQVGFNRGEFDRMINSHGVKMTHCKPIPCPNVQSLHGSDHDPACTKCMNGFQYYNKKEFIGAFMGNSLNRMFNMTGTWDLDQASIVVPATYPDGEELDMNFFDQITIPDFSIRYYQRVEASQTGVDRLHFPAQKVDKCVDAHENEYFQGVDFEINSHGYIQWTTPRRPGYNLDLDSGVIYSVNYYTKPAFTVVNLPHQLRASQTLENGASVQQRFSQVVFVRKDFIPYSSGDASGAPDTPSPRDGQT